MGMKILWMVPIVVLGVLWWMRRSGNRKARTR
jgi:hypothetical protein